MSTDDWWFSSSTDLGPLESRPLTPERFPDLERVFGERGVARRCFCMYWRRPYGGYGDTRDNRDRFHDRVRGESRPAGLVGYANGRPVGWVQVGPRTEFPALDRSRLLKRFDDQPVWSINCFVIAVGHRRRGIGRALAMAAVAFARHQGARVIEAYPVDGPRSGAADLFTGTMGMFVPLGFEEVVRRNDSRPIVRLRV